jgi:CO/xanthine dehydrogenase FAD-binding subunit
MRGVVAGLELLRPRSLAEALRWMARSERPTPLGGGTDLFVSLNAGTLEPKRFLDVTHLPELRQVLLAPSALSLGGGVTFRTVREHAGIARRFPALTAAAAEVGAWQIQNRATIAGNIANASPAGDSLPVLLVYDAVVHARSVRGARDIAFARLYRGYRSLTLEPDELITGVTIPSPPAGSRSFFRKVGTRRAQSISKVVFAGLIALAKDRTVSHARLAYGSMAPTPVRARSAETALLGNRLDPRTAAAARAALASDLAPIDDIRSERDYRMAVAGNVLEQFLRTLG